MSKHADPNKAYLWLDGDAYRGAAGMQKPADLTAADPANMLAFGGIEAGFNVTTEQTVNKKTVFNHRQSAYKVSRSPMDEGVTFRAVDDNEATRLTRAMGGQVTKVGERYELTKGDGEEFALLIQLNDGDDDMAIWCDRCTLSAPPTRAALDGENIDGWEFTVTFLSKPIEVLPATEGVPSASGSTSA